MTSVLLAPRCWGMDAAGFRRFTDFARVKAAGADWVSLYIDGNNGVNRPVVEAAWSAGLRVMLNFELYEQAAKYGYDQGVIHARRAMFAATDLGFLGESPLIFSGADFNPTAAQLPAVLDYHRALVDTYTLGPGGAYGPRSVLERLSQQPWWPADWPLWHWGGDGLTTGPDGLPTYYFPWAWVKQGPGGSYFNATVGLQVDNNLLLKPMRFWTGYGPDKPLDPDVLPGPPATTGRDDDMPVVYRTDDAIHWPGSSTLAEGDYPAGQFITFTLTDEGRVRHLPTTETQLYLRRGVTITVITGMELKQLIDDGGGVYDPATVSG